MKTYKIEPVTASRRAYEKRRKLKENLLRFANSRKQDQLMIAGMLKGALKE